jgi:hypothetical protein
MAGPLLSANGGRTSFRRAACSNLLSSGSRTREPLVKHLSQCLAVIGVALSLVQLHELLDLLADRSLCLLLIGNDQVSTFGLGLEQRALYRICDLVGVLELRSIS